MPRQKKIPKYGHHKPSGQARVLIGGQQIYFGDFGSSENREKYLRLVAEHSATVSQAPTPSHPGSPFPEFQSTSYSSNTSSSHPSITPKVVPSLESSTISKTLCGQ